MPVDVLHGYRRQVSALPHSCAEMGHHQRVSTELIKEMALDGQTIDAQDLSQDLGEGALGARHRVDAPVLSHRTLRGSDVSPFGQCAFRASSAQEPGKNEPITVSSPCWSARSRTSLATARSSTPSPNGLNTEKVSEPFLAGAPPPRMSAKVHPINIPGITTCSAN